ncbi:sugar kinase [Loktanella agnita]|uniref:sugar kinase n=1 Tax=Loktanella agnita TaxID=287097 RepID=UPI003989A619
MTQTLLSIGECMVEMAPQGDGTYAMGFAGDTFNTAWYAKRSAPALDIAYLSAVGDDAASAQLTDFIKTADIRPVLSVRAGHSVGLYLISLTDGERSFSYWRDTSAARRLAENLDGIAALGKGDMAFFSGITLAILPDSGRATLLDTLRAARAKGVQIAFDPNLRPRLWSDTSTMCDWVMRGAAVSDIALPSFEDEASFFNDASPEATLVRYQNSGAALVVVKNGAAPALVGESNNRDSIAPTPVATVIDTTAAGDSFNGRFLTGLLQGETAAAATKAACQVSARVISARGALVDL